MSKPLRVEVAGQRLRCIHCGDDFFFEESVALDRLVPGGLSNLKGWWGPQAAIYVCSACGFLHWFFAIDAYRHGRPGTEEAAEGVGYLADEAVDELEPSAGIEEMAERVDCLACGGPIPAGASACPACGWSWASSGERPA